MNRTVCDVMPLGRLQSTRIIIFIYTIRLPHVCVCVSALCLHTSKYVLHFYLLYKNNLFNLCNLCWIIWFTAIFFRLFYFVASVCLRIFTNIKLVTTLHAQCSHLPTYLAFTLDAIARRIYSSAMVFYCQMCTKLKLYQCAINGMEKKNREKTEEIVFVFRQLRPNVLGHPISFSRSW